MVSRYGSQTSRRKKNHHLLDLRTRKAGSEPASHTGSVSGPDESTCITTDSHLRLRLKSDGYSVSMDAGAEESFELHDRIHAVLLGPPLRNNHMGPRGKEEAATTYVTFGVAIYEHRPASSSGGPEWKAL